MTEEKVFNYAADPREKTPWCSGKEHGFVFGGLIFQSPDELSCFSPTKPLISESLETKEVRSEEAQGGK